MTLNNDAKAQSTSTQKTTHLTKKNSKSNGKSFLQLVTLIFTFIAVILAFYALDLAVRQRQGTQIQSQNLLHQIHVLKEQQREAKTNVETTMQSLIDTDYKLHNQLNNLNKNLQSTLQQRMYQAKDWLFLKARYYLELAQVNANWSDNLQASLALLQDANELLADTQDQRVLAIRQAIAKEIIQIQMIPKSDITGALSQLDAIQESIAKLPLKANFRPKTELSSSTNPNTTTSEWKKQLHSSLNLLQKLVVIRRHQEDVFSLPSPEYEFILRESIQLNLQEAQWALLKKNEAIYKLALSNTIKNIKRILTTDSEATRTVIKQINQLQEFQLTQQKPKLGESLHLLNEFIDAKDTLMTSPPEAAENAK